MVSFAKNQLLSLVGPILLLFAHIGFAQSAYWPRHTIDASYSGADGVRLADLNGDGFLDITTGWEEAGLTKVYLHPGHEAVKEKWPSVVIGQTPAVEDAMFFDYDGDSILDVVSSTEGKNRKIYFHKLKDSKNYMDSSEWTTMMLPNSENQMMWMYALPMDVDQKNETDFMAGGKGKDAKVGWFKSPKNPNELQDWIWHPVSNATWVMSLFTRDMDSDGDLDIVISDRKSGPTNGIRWLENPNKMRKKKSSWKNHFIGAEGLEVMFMDLADLDQDGLEDAITTEYTNQNIVFFKRLDDSGLNWESYEIPITVNTGRSKSVRVGDINGDGKQDIVHSTETNHGDKSGVWWLSYDKSPTETNWTWKDISGPDGIKYDRLELLDLDGDGDLDVLTCEENFGENSEGLGVIWYENPFK